MLKTIREDVQSVLDRDPAAEAFSKSRCVLVCMLYGHLPSHRHGKRLQLLAR
jgi:hypothetical protein